MDCARSLKHGTRFSEFYALCTPCMANEIHAGLFRETMKNCAGQFHNFYKLIEIHCDFIIRGYRTFKQNNCLPSLQSWPV